MEYYYCYACKANHYWTLQDCPVCGKKGTLITKQPGCEMPAMCDGCKLEVRRREKEQEKVSKAAADAA